MVLGVEKPVKGVRTRKREDRESFSVVFYGLESFGCKSAQFYVTRCKPHSLGLPMICNVAQHSENVRNSLVLNYKSAALNQLSYAGVSPYGSRF